MFPSLTSYFERALVPVASEILKQEIAYETSPAEIWNSIAKHVLGETINASTSSDPYAVLSALLDKAVSIKDFDQRKTYIERIMKTNKQTQKRLMALIEKRRRKTPSSKTPPKPTSAASANRKPPTSILKSSPIYSTPQKSTDLSNLCTPQTYFLKPSEKDSATPSSARASRRTTNTGTRSTSRSRSIQSPSRETPVAKRVEFLSPGTLDSPNQVQSILRELNEKNGRLEKIIARYHEQTQKQQQQMEKMEQNHRKETMQLESKAMDRASETQKEYMETIEDLQEKLSKAEKEASEGRQAQEELSRAKEELEVLNHSRTILSETTEKLRKYKERITELQDVKENLKREQHAHAEKVDEIVRLENELQTLLPLKSQVEAYKHRALEAEVKLVECQDYLKRIKQQITEKDVANQNLLRNTMMQEREMEAMRARIQEETRANMEASRGLGDGVSELNPQLHEELVRLRNENLQLRAFCDKRKNDRVVELEQMLENTKGLSEKFKSNYLDVKECLAQTQSVLEETQHRETALTEEVAGWKGKSNKVSHECRQLREKLDKCQNLLQQTEWSLVESQAETNRTQETLNTWKTRCQELERLGRERMNEIDRLSKDLEATEDNFVQSQQETEDLRSRLENLEKESNEIDNARLETQKKLDETIDDLHECKIDLEESIRRVSQLEDEIKVHLATIDDLQQVIDEERSQKTQAVNDAAAEIESVKRRLEQQKQDELDALEQNMNAVLDDERRARQSSEEENDEKLAKLELYWQTKYQELEESSEEAQESYNEEMESLRNRLTEEHKKEIERVLAEADQKQTDLIHKGKEMISESKSKAKEIFLELANEKQQLEDKLALVEKEKSEMDQMLRSKIAKLRQGAEYANQQINGLNEQNDDLSERMKVLEREKSKLEEDNDRYRRQLSGRYGAEGTSNSQHEKLQREYNSLLEEHRKLKQQLKDTGGIGGTISESEGGSYSRRGMNRSTLTQMRAEYEEKIGELNDEKRELVMKYSAAISDVQKAEQRTWEREEEITKLKSEITSMKLTLQRMELSQNQNENETPRHDSDSFYSAKDTQRTPASEAKTPQRPSSSSTKRSPGIEQRMQRKALQESVLRSKLSSFASPHKDSLNVSMTAAENDTSRRPLTPTSKHNSPKSSSRNTSFFQNESGASVEKRPSLSPPGRIPQSFPDYVRGNEVSGDEGQQECQQS